MLPRPLIAAVGVVLITTLTGSPARAEGRAVTHDLRTGETWSHPLPPAPAVAGPVWQQEGDDGARGDFGEDDESEVKDTAVYPYSTACRLSFSFAGSGGWWSCSGTLIGPHHVLTAGHCVFQQEEGGWIDTMTVSPGYDNGAEPYGVAVVDRVHVLEEWLWDEHFLYDMALVSLDRDVGEYAGYLGYESLEDPAQYVGPPFDCNHFPGSPIGDTHTMFHSHDEVIHADELVLGHFLDTAPGSSGAGIYRDDGEQGFLVGVNSSHWTGYNNLAPRFNPARIAWLENQFAEDPVPEDLPDLVPDLCYPGGETATQGEEFGFTIKVLNWGSEVSPSAEVSFHASLDSNITHNDPELGRGTIDPVAPFEPETAQLTVVIPDDLPPEVYRVGVILDPDDEVAEVGGTNFAGECAGTVLVLPAQDPGDDDTGDDDAGDDDTGGEACECTAAGAGAPAGAGLLVVLGLAGLLRRRR